MLTHSGPQLCPAQHHDTILSQVAGRERGLGDLVLVPGTWHRASGLPIKSLDATLAARPYDYICLMTNGSLSGVSVPPSPALRKGLWLLAQVRVRSRVCLVVPMLLCPAWVVFPVSFPSTRLSSQHVPKARMEPLTRRHQGRKLSGGHFPWKSCSVLSSVAGSEVSRNTLMVSMQHPYVVGSATAGLRAHLGQSTKVQVTTGSTIQGVG